MKKTKRKTKPYERYLARREFKNEIMWNELTETHLADFKKRFGPSATAEFHRNRRKEIIGWFGKPPEQLTLEEFKDYSKPSFSARDFLGELWPQLTSDEQEITKNLTEWAWIFPASFENERQFLVACASRLQKFFGRKFCVGGEARK